MSANALSVAERMDALSRSPVFARVPARDLGVLAEMMETERLAAGEALFEFGDPSDRVYVVAQGRLGVFLPGSEAAARSLGPGDLLGEYGMFASGGRTAGVRAETGAVLLALDYGRFRAFLLHFPESALVLLETAVARLTALESARR